MATFTSTINGNWNDGATWGLTSPGVKGTDWPGLAGDIVNIGHTVTYNVVETNELGQVTINNGGILTFLATANTKITLGHQDIRIESGGELRIGASAAVIDKAYKAELVWNTTVDNAKGIYVVSGGKLNIYGDPTYYGSDDDTELAADWTTGQTFTVVGDFTAKWNVNDEITVHKGAAYSNYNTDTALFTIASLALNGSNTDITINEAAPGVTFYAGGQVINVTRNVKLSKLNAVTTIGNYNTNRPRIYDANASGNNNCKVSAAMVTGFNRIESNYDFQFLKSVIRNGYLGFYGGTNHTVSGNMYSNQYGFYDGANHTISGNVYSNNYTFYYGANHTISGNVYSNQHGFYDGANHTISGNVYSNNYGVNSGINHTVSGNVYSNQNGFYGGANHTISGKIGYDSNDVSTPNTYDFRFGGSNDHLLKNVKLPLNGLVFYNRYTSSYRGRIRSEHHGQVANAQKVYDMFGDIIKVTAGSGTSIPDQRSGGAQYLAEMESLTANCGSVNPLLAFSEHKIWAETGSKIYRYYLQTDHTGGLSAGEIKLTGKYLDQASGGHLGEATHAPAVAIRTGITDWSQYLEVTINPAQAGIVALKIELMTYEAGKKVWIDPKVVIS